MSEIRTCSECGDEFVYPEQRSAFDRHLNECALPARRKRQEQAEQRAEKERCLDSLKDAGFTEKQCEALHALVNGGF